MKVLLIVAFAFSVVVATQTGTLSPADIDAAIKAGPASKLLLGSSCLAIPAFSDFGPKQGGFNAIALGPFGRIMRAARDAKTKYLPFAATDVTDDMKAPTLLVEVTPRAPSGNTITAIATHLVLKSKPPKNEQPIVLQPLSIHLDPTSWNNTKSGAHIDGQGVTATFDLAAFKAIPHEEVDIVVITPSGERRCKIGADDKRGIK